MTDTQKLYNEFNQNRPSFDNSFNDNLFLSPPKMNYKISGSGTAEDIHLGDLDSILNNEKIWSDGPTIKDDICQNACVDLQSITEHRNPSSFFLWNAVTSDPWSRSNDESSVDWSPSSIATWESKTPNFTHENITPQALSSENIHNDINIKSVFQNVWSAPNSKSFSNSEVSGLKTSLWRNCLPKSVKPTKLQSLDDDGFATPAANGSTETLNNTQNCNSFPLSSLNLDEPPESSATRPSDATPVFSTEGLLTQLINAHDGWGTRCVDQSTPWQQTDEEEEREEDSSSNFTANNSQSSSKPLSNLNPEPFTLLNETNVWTNEPPIGTGIWELHYEQLGKKTARWRHEKNSQDPNDLPRDHLATSIKNNLPSSAAHFILDNQRTPDDSTTWSNRFAQSDFDSWRTTQSRLPLREEEFRGNSNSPILSTPRPLLGSARSNVCQTNYNKRSSDVPCSAICGTDLWYNSNRKSEMWPFRGAFDSVGETANFNNFPPATSFENDGCIQNQTNLIANGFSPHLMPFFTSDSSNATNLLENDKSLMVHPYSHTYRADLVKHFINMGYRKEDVHAVLISCNMDFEYAIQKLKRDYRPMRMTSTNTPPIANRQLYKNFDHFPIALNSPPPSIYPDLQTDVFCPEIDCQLTDEFSKFRMSSPASFGFADGINTIKHLGQPFSSTNCVGRGRFSATTSLANSNGIRNSSNPQLRSVNSNITPQRGINSNNIGDLSQFPGSGLPFGVSILGLPPDGTVPHSTLSGVGFSVPTIGEHYQPTRSPCQNIAGNSIHDLQRKQQKIIKQIQSYRNNAAFCSQPRFSAIFNELKTQLNYIELQIRNREASANFNQISGFPTKAVQFNPNHLKNSLSGTPFTTDIEHKRREILCQRYSSQPDQDAGFNYSDFRPTSKLSTHGYTSFKGNDFRSPCFTNSSSILGNLDSSNIENSYPPNLDCVSGPYLQNPSMNGGIRRVSGQWAIVRPGFAIPNTSLEQLHILLAQQPGLTHFHPDHLRRKAFVHFNSIEQTLEARQALAGRVNFDFITDSDAQCLLQELTSSNQI